MAESKRSAHWVAGLAVLAAIAVGTWLILGRSAERSEVGEDAPARPQAGTPAPALTGQDAPIPELRIASRGRLTLDEAALSQEDPLILALDLSDEARGSGDRTVRVVSEDGRRIDTIASPLPGAGSGLHLEIDPDFLAPGRYMIEVDTAEKHPLQIRRYVLELK